MCEYKNKLGSYDVIVIGAGHAGIEAAAASAKLGAKTALFTMTLDGIGNLPCNPSIGGTAKGHLVREIDALGGVMAKAADATFLQSRMLNKGKGPAVHSLRVQSDRAKYHQWMKQYLERHQNLDLKQGEITALAFEGQKVVGVYTQLQAFYEAKAVVVATGTYLGGKIFVGEASYLSGPDGHHAAIGLTESLREVGVFLRRFKTGTPARVNTRSINYSKLEEQPGDDYIEPFSFMTKGKLENKVSCYIAYTNEETHQVIKDNLHRSPLYGGKIEGIGPRYCPSIEDKVVRFGDKPRHQLFVEPCGMETDEMYLQGMSSSLPEEVQNAMYKTITGFENLEIMRPAYAIEYDCIDPLQLNASLAFKNVQGLYGAGQFNGTSGYEEAAAQGLIAGINAALFIQKKEPFTLTRQNSYIGTLIDDLVTKGVSDPYRMMTSRSEYRLYLRQDNADERLTPLGYEIGLVDAARWAEYENTQRIKQEEIQRLQKTFFKPTEVQALLEKHGLNTLNSGISAFDLLKRPQLSYEDVVALAGENPEVTLFISHRIETEIKYDGYIKRQQSQIKAVQKQENMKIPTDFDYAAFAGLRLEAREKLARVKPENLGQAARIPGVSPADISMLMLELTVRRAQNKKEE
ncbi:MAG: tRNA uridine-5-carboxymethylaminomethyl(34) synthesis enzyme MnmG [Oscillospiraceae bacterium]|nr:tRNA uridine-5-carboxymethylaminomethyl(34) synthesis enzyme MnmG [Oscillospiraceae bacterium]